MACRVARPSMPAQVLPTADPMPLVRYLDVVLVVLAAPFALLMGAPALGFLVGAGAWVLHRALGVLVEHRARSQADPRKALGLNLGGVIARTWLVGLTILVVGLAGAREDGLTAAVVLLSAFTVYFATTLLLRPLERRSPRT
jgi:hypothetical protein